MSTHFHPRLSTSAPQSPIRPGSARPTIRAITPSPPHDLSIVSNENRARSGKLYSTSPEAIEQPKMRPQSEDILQTRSHALKNEEIVTTHEITADHAELQRGDSIMARRSPVRRQDGIKSYRSRLDILPTAQSSCHGIRVENQVNQGKERSGYTKHNEAKKVQRYHNKDLSIDCPDTPTPMTLLQKRSAYLPLGTQTPTVLPELSSSKRSSPVATSTRTRSSADRELSPSPNNPDINVKKPLADCTVKQTNPLAQHPHTSLANTDETAKPAVSQPYARSYHLPLDSNPQNIVQQPDAIYRTPYKSRYSNALPSSTAPHKPLAVFSTPAQHFASPSRVSNNSGSTGQSQRSVFSTPGRDEFERKKAKVEVDEGPFGRVVSVAQLNEARKVVSGGIVVKWNNKGYDEEEEEDGKDKKKERTCGMSGACSVM